jgi:CubicO group peptidase (beta-lactamase class C family)
LSDSSGSPDRATGPAAEEPTAGPAELPDRIAQAVRKKVADHQVEWRSPSVAALVVRDGAPVHFTGVGTTEAGLERRPPTDDTQYRIGSITKTFTATLVMQCRDDGLLALDHEIGRYIPDTKHGGLSIRRMLSHLSGLQREPHGDIWESGAGPDLPALLAGLEQADAVLPPGRRFHYSNLAYSLLGEVVARLRGASWADVLRDRILRPLEMGRTTVEASAPKANGYLVDPYADRVSPEPLFPGHAFAPAGELWSTPSDLGRWASFLADPSAEVLSADTLEEMCHPQVMFDLDEWSLAWGLGLMLHRRGERVLIGHDGAMPGFLAGLAVRRPEKVGTVVFANTTAGADPGALAIALTLDVVDDDPALPQVWQVGSPVPAEYEELLGRWWSEGSEFIFAVHNGELTARRTDQPPTKPPAVFERVDTDLYRTASGREHGELLRIIRDEEGGVSKMYWATYPFTRRPTTFGPQPTSDPDGPHHAPG